MSEGLQYKGYEGSILYSKEDKMFHGRLMLRGDFVTYGGDDLEELEKNFRDATDEYLAFCREQHKESDEKWVK